MARKTKTDTTTEPNVKRATKQNLAIAMLRRQDGASIPEICAATGWQPHSVRGFMSGALKKRLGIDVVSEKAQGGERRYFVAPIRLAE